MVKYQKYSIPGIRKITHGKLSDRPHFKAVSMEENKKPDRGIPLKTYPVPQRLKAASPAR